MNAKKLSRPFFVLLWLGAALPAAASDEVEPQYRRDRKTQPAASGPRAAMPDALRLETPELPSLDAKPESQPENQPATKSETTPEARRKRGTIRDHNPPDAEPGRGEPGPQGPQGGYGELARQASDAAAWAARELARTQGRRNYYRVGFYQGLHAAFDDPSLGRWDEREGESDGRRDPEALRRGDDLGAGDADQRAGEAAAAEVAAQFHDLSREPSPEPAVGRWDFEPRLPPVREPALERVMGDYPLGRFVSSRDFGPAPDPWEVYNDRSYGDVYDSRWQKPGVGFELWRENRGRGFWRGLDDGSKAFFERTFVRAYPHWLGRERPALERAWDDGWDDGWSYGAFVVAEYRYRRGYREGYAQAFGRAADAAFDRIYPRAYEAHYRRHFDDWDGSAHPELRGAWLEDEDGDGVFEPGEDVLATYEIANYGGRALDADLRLDGSVLRAAASQPIFVPRRTSQRASRPLLATIDERTPPRTNGRLTLAVAGVSEELPLRVAFPLELDREVVLRAQDTSAGRASFELGVRNQSRRSAAGWAELVRADGRPAGRRLELGAVEAGARRSLSFEVEGLDPLELVAGESQVRVVLRGGDTGGRDTVYDELSYRFPDRVSDLGRRDLLEVMIELAQEARPDSAAIARAQRLMLRRLEVDWQAAGRARGNPYQEDLDEGTRKTALGDLVASYRGNRRVLRHPEVFEALAPRVRDLAESLPGTHPFLRRSMKRLARELER